MPKRKARAFEDYVFALSDDEFKDLKEAVNKRIDKESYEVTSFEEAAIKYERKPLCPKCQSDLCYKDGYTPVGHIRYRCNECDCSFTLLSDSIFNSAKLPFHKLMNCIELMSFNVPLNLLCEILDIAPNTAKLWRKKIFETVNGYQDHLKLYGDIWIDETYIEDYEVLTESIHHPRGLSKHKICIVVAIDSYKNMIAAICGHGKPSKRRIYKALSTHINSGATIIHDGNNSHNELIEKLNLTSKVYKADCKDTNYLKNMALINNMCGWVKRYIWRFIGMDINNLQSYLNWFIYLYRCKRDNEKWPKSNRILRHLVLERTRLTRKIKKSQPHDC